jgi:hypothetical protein
MQFRIGSYAFNMNRERIPDVPTLGVTNRTEDGFFVVFMDYDGVEWNVVRDDVIHAHRVWGLHNFVVLANETWENESQWGDKEEHGDYLLFGLDKMSYWQCMRVQSHMRGDRMHKRVGTAWAKRCWVNRIAAKYAMEDGEVAEIRPEPRVRQVYMFRGVNPYPVSRAFVTMFREWFRLRLPLKAEDDGRVEVIEYSTIRKKGR